MAVGVQPPDGSGERVEEHLGIRDPEREHPERTEPDHRQLFVPEQDGLCGSPLLTCEGFEVHEVDFGAEGAREPGRQRKHLGQDGNVQRRQRVAARPQGVQRASVSEEDRGLALADDELCPHLDLGGTVCRIARHDGVARRIQALDDLDDLDELRHAAHSPTRPRIAARRSSSLRLSPASSPRSCSGGDAPGS